MIHQTYTKINTLYKRDAKKNNTIIIGDYSCPEFEYLKNNIWECTEKIDGTNMSYYWDGENLEIHGKTEFAQIPNHLLVKMQNLLTKDTIQEIFPPSTKYFVDGIEQKPTIIIYGEGYGMKIQKGGNYIKNDVSFRVFDININGYWLNRENIEDISNKLKLEVVPLIG